MTDEPAPGTGGASRDVCGASRDVCGAVAAARAVLASCVDTSSWVLGDAEVLAGAEAAQRLAASATELVARLVAEADTRGLAREQGAVSGAAWLRTRTRLTSQAAGDVARVGASLAIHEATRAALASGGLCVEQAAVITRLLERLPHTVDTEQILAAEQYLLDQARVFDARTLRRLGRRLLEVIDPEGADAHEAAQLEDEEARARARCWFAMRARGDGTTTGRFVLPDAQASMLRAVLEAISNPRRHTTGDHQPNTGPTATDNPGSSSPGSSSPGSSGDNNPGSSGGPFSSDPFSSGPFSSEPGSGGDTGDQQRVSYPQRMGQALADLIEHLPADAFPQSGGLAASVVINLDYDQLREALGSATLSTGEVISASQARRLACGAGILPAVFGGASLPLDLGRSRRLHTPAQRIALGVTQHGCVFGDCDRPAAWCDTHHTEEWAEGGCTNLNTAALLCPIHHHHVHQTGWRVTIDEAGIPHTIPPPSIDPHQRPRTHPRFREPPPRHGPHRHRQPE